MQALQLHGPGDLRLVDRDPPADAADRVPAAVIACGLCRTDAKMWSSGHRDLVLPRVPGHEVVVRHPETGDPCAVWPGSACLACDRCREGRTNLCREIQILGFHCDGGLAEQVLVSPGNLLPLPEGVRPQLGTLAEPLACGINALERLMLMQGESFLIHGGGPMGLLLALAARSWGARVTIVEASAARRQRVAACCELLDATLSAPPDGLILTAGNAESGFDAGANAAPEADAVAQGLAALRPGGRYCLFSGLVSESPLSVGTVNLLHYQEIAVVGAYGCTRHQLGQALAMLQARRDVAEKLVERSLSFAEVETALADILDGTVLRCVVEPGG